MIMIMVTVTITITNTFTFTITKKNREEEEKVRPSNIITFLDTILLLYSLLIRTLKYNTYHWYILYTVLYCTVLMFCDYSWTVVGCCSFYFWFFFAIPCVCYSIMVIYYHSKACRYNTWMSRVDLLHYYCLQYDA